MELSEVTGHPILNEVGQQGFPSSLPTLKYKVVFTLKYRTQSVYNKIHYVYIKDSTSVYILGMTNSLFKLLEAKNRVYAWKH